MAFSKNIMTWQLPGWPWFPETQTHIHNIFYWRISNCIEASKQDIDLTAVVIVFIRLTNLPGQFLRSWYHNRHLVHSPSRIHPKNWLIYIARYLWFEQIRLYLDILKARMKVFIGFNQRLVHKLWKSIEQTQGFWRICKGIYGVQGNMWKQAHHTWRHKYLYSLPFQARLFLVRFRKAVGNRWIFISWAPQFAQKPILRVGYD